MTPALDRVRNITLCVGSQLRAGGRMALAYNCDQYMAFRQLSTDRGFPVVA